MIAITEMTAVETIAAETIAVTDEKTATTAAILQSL